MYSMTIARAERDQVYLVSLPDWQDRLIGPAATHGATYEEATGNGQIVLDMLIADAVEDGEPLPEPKVFPLA
ncbi:MAG TPA: type II toxin-antitoxin system HicB family antitoxin [Ktedonobacterales bacterium]|nr:type II toxin-antitoxin system HicB family antitoxin [Ktedonobacterales bacterium]